MAYRLGIDIGSTTVKTALIDENNNIIHQSYRRHMSDVRGGLLTLFSELKAEYGDTPASVSITGSAGMSCAGWVGVPFVQEVIAATASVERLLPETDVVIELGGEDAKITFMKPVLSQRMNGTCAGGTGAFIDQMASLLQTDVTGLNELAKDATMIYSIASRCGVFAKSDLQPLLNDGARKEDLAASVLTAVVNQMIAGLACGQPIRGNIVFLGGPLHFLSELRVAFEKALAENATSFTLPENAHLFVALGAAYLSAPENVVSIGSLYDKLAAHKADSHEIERMPKLFETDADRDAFFERHNAETIGFSPITEAKGGCFLGIDAGSTTIKAVLINGDGQIVYNFYSSNNGTPLDSATVILKDIYSSLPADAYIESSCVTGYGEQLLQTAFRIDNGEIETLAHYKAAKSFDPEVDYIIDIGGQDMKCMHIKKGVVDSITLNEACSSGCGSFIQTFAKSLGLEPAGLSREALTAENPVDLGTRCTVFMNSRVKQAQKEGATVGDISAGLAYAVVRNALFKVIKLRSPEQLGRNIVVQGGTFYNDAILRCFEIISGRQVIRPSIAGLMGAYGAAIIAKERSTGKSNIITSEELTRGISVRTTSEMCGNCQNNCKLTITEFDGGRRLVSGNRCERGEGKALASDKLPNLVRYKYARLFSYKPLDPATASRGVIGVPRALNMYEKYPLWFTVLTALGFSVHLSKRSDHKLFELGMSTIPSESVCYPAKLAHGHIIDLINSGVPAIFMPCMPYEVKENPEAGNHYNCPIVTSYPEVIENNIELLREKRIRFFKPFINVENLDTAARVLAETFSDYGVTKAEALAALKSGLAEQEKFHADMRAQGEKTIREIHEKGLRGIVLAGRPYHVDPEINHGLPQMINTLGFAVLTEDSVSHLATVKRPIRVVDQWVYHSRLYNAAAFTCGEENIELVQLNSFGCGLDAVTTDQVQEILEANDQIYTCLKIDEINNLGAARIRMRSLAVVLKERQGHTADGDSGGYVHSRTVFTKEMRRRTIIGPQMSPIHFDLIEDIARANGYNLKLLRNATREDIEAGLRHVNNDACYPSILTVGQLINAIESGECDPDDTAMLITQTGGGCRATNYIAFLRKALRDAGYPDIPVISVNMAGLEKNPGFKLTLPLIDNVLKGLIIGDAMQNMLYRVRPYELEKGSADALYEKWRKIAKDSLSGRAPMPYSKLMKNMVHDFDTLPIDENRIIPRVGVVGEILVKFHPDANNHVVDVIESEGCEAVVPGLTDFFLYSCNTGVFKHEQLGLPKSAEIKSKLGIWFIEKYREPMRKALAASRRFDAPCPITELGKKAEKVLSLGNVCGEGWLLTAEMIELIESDAPNIICTQPFSCLPNHVTGKGMIKELRRLYPQSNICPVDYDPGASEVNQLNRIKLMISSARKNLAKAQTDAKSREKSVTAKETAAAKSAK